MALGDNLPQPNKAVGQTGHVTDTNAIIAELAATQTVVRELEANPPQILGTVTRVEDLPTTGTPGDMYFVGQNTGTLWSWVTQPTPGWVQAGGIKGDQGVPGQSGTIIGILGAGQNPPIGTLSGTLWFQLDSGSPPATDLTPSHVGSVAAATGQAGLTLIRPDGVNDGDLGILVVAYGGSTTATPPTGWTDIDPSTPRLVSSLQIRLYAKVMGATDGNIVVPGVTGVKTTAALTILRNVELTGGAAHKLAYSAPTSALVVNAPTVSPTVASVIVGVWADRVGATNSLSTLTKPAGLTLGASGMSAEVNGAVSSAIAYSLTPTTTANSPTGTQQWTKSGTLSTQGPAMFTLALAQKTA